MVSRFVYDEPPWCVGEMYRTGFESRQSYYQVLWVAIPVHVIVGSSRKHGISWTHVRI